MEVIIFACNDCVFYKTEVGSPARTVLRS